MTILILKEDHSDAMVRRIQEAWEAGYQRPEPLIAIGDAHKCLFIQVMVRD